LGKNPNAEEKTMSNKLYVMGTWLNDYEDSSYSKEDEEEANELNPTYEKEVSAEDNSEK